MDIWHKWIIIHTVPTRGQAPVLPSSYVLGFIFILNNMIFHFYTKFLLSSDSWQHHFPPLSCNVLGFHAQDNVEHPPQLDGEPLG